MTDTLSSSFTPLKLASGLPAPLRPVLGVFGAPFPLPLLTPPLNGEFGAGRWPLRFGAPVPVPLAPLSSPPAASQLLGVGRSVMFVHAIAAWFGCTL